MSDIGPLWSSFHDGLLRFFLARTRDAALAEDLVQDVFLRVHQRLGQVEDEERIAGWIHRIARNVWVDHLRRGKGAAASLDETHATTIPAAERDPLRDDLVSCLGPMIERLEEGYREAVRLSEIEGLSQREVGERLGLGLSGAKSRVQRGRQQLRRMFERCCHLEFDHRGQLTAMERTEGSCGFCSTTC
ncbi:RNA polymerase sigma factor SigZ [Vulgatibacter sp.]|uniref:RNA polymerase sigma factor SigZ n=1 Tax=Vulgatibacter sp. TaxID=1971226 RepID=UPI0035627D3C